MQREQTDNADKKSIPVNTFADEFCIAGIGIGKISVDDIHMLAFKGIDQSHRDDYHLFILQEKGTTTIEVDFKKHKIEPSSIIYIHPNQVHRVIAVENVTFSGWGINNENLIPEYLTLLGDMTPAKPLLLKKEAFSILSEAVSLCMNIFERKDEKLYHYLVKDSCNTLVVLASDT